MKARLQQKKSRKYRLHDVRSCPHEASIIALFLLAWASKVDVVPDMITRVTRAIDYDNVCLAKVSSPLLELWPLQWRKRRCCAEKLQLKWRNMGLNSHKKKSNIVKPFKLKEIDVSILVTVWCCVRNANIVESHCWISRHELGRCSAQLRTHCGTRGFSYDHTGNVTFFRNTKKYCYAMIL